MINNKKASVFFIFATILLDALGIGLLIPVFPDVLRRFNTDPEFVNHYFGYFISLYALMQLLASPILGALADKYGRRPILLVSLFFGGLDYLVMAFAPNLFILFLGRVISGLTGANQTVASSYMADISDDSNRSANFGLIGAAWGVGFIIGPGIGGLLMNSGMAAPFIAAAVLNLLNFAFGYFILPESLPADQRREIQIKNLNPFTSLLKVFKTPAISTFAWIYFLLYLAGQVNPSMWTLYTEYKFHWTAWEVGWSLSFAGLMIAIGHGYLTRVIIPILGETKSVFMGIFLEMVTIVAFAFLPYGWLMFPTMILFAISSVAQPAIQSLISKDIPMQEQGELQGSLISIGSFTSIIGPLLYTFLFAYTTKPDTPFLFPGSPYIAAAVIMLVAMVLAWTSHLGHSKS